MADEEERRLLFLDEFHMPDHQFVRFGYMEGRLSYLSPSEFPVYVPDRKDYEPEWSRLYLHPLVDPSGSLTDEEIEAYKARVNALLKAKRFGYTDERKED